MPSPNNKNKGAYAAAGVAAGRRHPAARVRRAAIIFFWWWGLAAAVLGTLRPTLRSPKLFGCVLASELCRDIDSGTFSGEVYRSLFRAHLDDAAMTDIRKALQRDQALGNERFREQVELALGRRLAPKRRGRKREEGVKDEAGQMVLGL